MPTPAPAAARSRCGFSRSLLFLLAVPHPLTPSPRRGEGERGRGTRCRLRGQVRRRAPSFLDSSISLSRPMRLPNCVHRTLLIALSVFVSAPAVAQRPRNPRPGTGHPPPTDRLIDSLLARMTLEEKLGQLNLPSVDGRPSAEQLDMVRRGQVGGFLNLTGAAATREAQQVAVTQSRLHVPLLLGYDVIHGYRTTFPIPLAEAATWDPAAAESTAHVAAREAAAAGVNWTFAPMVDIARDPRWGRIAEGAGEDPYLVSAMAAARVRGFQGSDLRTPEAVMATAKHFAAYGGAEGGRDYNTVDVSERTLRETYLRSEEHT